MHFLKKSFLFLLFFAASKSVFAQATAVFTDTELAYKRGVEFYDKGLFGQALREFQQVVVQSKPANQAQYTYLISNAELYRARCAVQMGLPEGEQLIQDYIRRYSSEPAGSQALVEMANYYYNAKKYEEATRFFDQISISSLSPSQRAEVKFKQGYAYFVQKKFSQAKACFKVMKDDAAGQYYAPANYYYGMTAFFENNYEEANKAFQKVSTVKKYKPYVPYYICQIYFAQGKYDQLLSYATPLTDDSEVGNKPEIKKLIGQAYFEKSEFKKALPYLEGYAEESGKMREEDFYQLATAQYRTGNYKKATRNFEEISKLDSKMGQVASYYLGDCYVKTGNKSSARSAFATASKLSFDKEIQQEASYNYGKLSYELKFDNDAIIAMQKVKSDSKYYNEAQQILGTIFLNNRSYDKAITIIDAMNPPSAQMREALQKVTYFRGVQYYNAGDYSNAKALFNRSLSVPVSKDVQAMATYGLADIAHQNKEYASSVSNLNQFFSLAKGVDYLPDDVSTYTANYLQGYNYLKQNKYADAQKYFAEAATSIKRDMSKLSNPNVTSVILGDATLRAGDCYFKANKYKEARKFYDEAINKKYSGYVYAIYQKGMIEGLEKDNTGKLVTLEKLVKDYPQSEFTDEALFEIASTYQNMNQLDKASKPLNTLIANYKGKSPLVNQAYLRLGLIAYNQGNVDQAMGYYKSVFQNNATKEEGKEALDALKEIYINDKSDPDGYTQFATSTGYKVSDEEKSSLGFEAAEKQYSNGSYDKAIQSYTDYLKKYPTGPNAIIAYYKRAESYYAKKDYASALKDYEAVIAKGPSNYYEKSLNKGALIAYNAVKDFGKGYELYSKLEKVASTEQLRFDAQLGALSCAYRTNNKTGITEMANKVVKNPAASNTQKAQANFYLGKTAFDGKDYNTALTAFNGVVKALPDSEQAAEARYSIAYIYYQRRELELAETLCTNANQESSGYDFWIAKSMVLLADIYAERGDTFNARATLEGLLDGYQGPDANADLIKEAKAKLDALNSKAKTNSRLKTDDTNKLDMDSGGK